MPEFVDHRHVRHRAEPADGENAARDLPARSWPGQRIEAGRDRIEKCRVQREQEKHVQIQREVGCEAGAESATRMIRRQQQIQYEKKGKARDAQPDPGPAEHEAHDAAQRGQRAQVVAQHIHHLLLNRRLIRSVQVFTNRQSR